MSRNDAPQPVRSSSRRLFLTAGRMPSHPWGAFCMRLQRACKGVFHTQPSFHGFGRAELVASTIADVHHALALCREYGIVLATNVSGNRAASAGAPVLWVRPGAGMARCEPMNDDEGRWFAQPGCAIGQLQSRGFGQFHGMDPTLTLADWLLGTRHQPWPSGATAQSGLVYASVLLSDGSRAGLGPFGERNTKPLEGVRLQRLVSDLFTLISGPLGQACRSQLQWPVRYRLDALTPDGAGINLAHLILGSVGELAWVDWVVLEPRDAAVEQARAGSHCNSRESSPEVTQAAIDLSARIKRLFDPQNILPGQHSV